MVDFNEHTDVIKMLGDAQNVEYDNREAARESDHFVNKRDGQWEPQVISALNHRPRYTFDQVTPILDQVSGEIDRASFSIDVTPTSGQGSMGLAMVYEGLIRNIENMSNARDVYGSASCRSRETGLAGWRVDHDWVDGDSFEQDLIIRRINNFIDRVWFDPNSELPDNSDANWCVVLDVMTKEAYFKKYPEGSGQSVSDSRQAQVYTHQRDAVVIGELLYRKPYTQELVLMSNGEVYVDDEEFEKVVDELAIQGITELRRRSRKTFKVFSRVFDAGSWLSKAKETVFCSIPIVPVYANHKVSENKVVYHSLVEKLMDPQRVYNYAKSRQIEEGALAPRAKYWMTKAQANGHERTLQTLNTNADPVQFYNHIEGVAYPQQIGGAQINPGLQQTAADAASDINKVAGMFSANIGDNPGLQTGVAIERLQNKGDNGTYKYFTALARAITRTGKLLIKAIPKVYDTQRTIRILGMDGSSEMVPINYTIVDEQTGDPVTLNDMNQGKYDVTCSIGPAFQNRQQQAVSALTEIAQVDPSILQIGGDVLLNNIDAPGVKQVAERKRAIMVKEGIIPPNQLTQTEVMQQMSAPPPEPTPMDQALIAQAQAETEKAQAGTADTISKIEERQANSKLKQQKLLADINKDVAKQEFDEVKLEADVQQTDKEFMLEVQKQNIETQNAIVKQLNVQAQTLETIMRAIGADAMMGPPVAQTLDSQLEVIQESQENQD